MKLSAFTKCRVIVLQVTSKRGAPQSPHGRDFRLARRVVGAMPSGRATYLKLWLDGASCFRPKEATKVEARARIGSSRPVQICRTDASILGQLNAQDMSIAEASDRLSPFAGRATFSLRVAFRGCQPGLLRSHCIMCRS